MIMMMTMMVMMMVMLLVMVVAMMMVMVIARNSFPNSLYIQTPDQPPLRPHIMLYITSITINNT